jgi:hypothetical protein
MRRIAPVILLLCLTACTDQQLEKVSKGLVATADGIGVVQTTVIEANKQLLVDDATTSQIMIVCMKVNQAGKDATAITRAISKLDNPSKSQLLAVLNPVIAAVQNALDNGLVPIKDPATQQKIRGALLAVQTALNAAQLALAGS